MNEHSNKTININININKQISGMMLGAFFCTTGMVLGQAQPASPHNFDPGHSQMPPGLNARLTKQARLDQAARAALSARDYEAAEDYARQSLDMGEGSGMSQQLLVEVLDDQGRGEEALPIYKVMWKQGETSPDYILPYALLLLKSGQWAQAVAAYNRALPYLNQGDLVRAHSNFSPSAPRILDLATAIHIGLGVTYLNGNDWGGRDQHAKAMLHFRQALALAPNNALANYQYGVALASVGRPIEAKAAFKKAAQTGQSDREQADVKKAAQAALR